MTYTVKVDLWIDEIGMTSDDEICEYIKTTLSGASEEVMNVEVLDVND